MGEIAVLAALHHRQRTGKGQYIELSQTESIMRMMSWVWPYQEITGKTAMPAGQQGSMRQPGGYIPLRDDRFVAIAAAGCRMISKDFVMPWAVRNWSRIRSLRITWIGCRDENTAGASEDYFANWVSEKDSRRS